MEGMLLLSKSFGFNISDRVDLVADGSTRVFFHAAKLIGTFANLVTRTFKRHKDFGLQNK